ncbi:MAG TPA: AI-2E family transporter [Methylomirabilota bacterium]|nr:AI-2E family transporter [Methylomirabilota bacterium]
MPTPLMTDGPRPNTPAGEASRRAFPSFADRARDERSQALRHFKPLIVLAAAALICACLALAREVLIPVAVSGLLALLLTPLVDAIQRRGVHRVEAVLLVVVLVFSVIGGVVWMLALQVTTLANDLPQYRHNIRQKVADVRLFGRGGSVEKMQDTVKDVVGELEKDAQRQSGGRPPVPVVHQGKPFWQLPSTIGAVAEIGATIGFVIVLVCFMLIERHELRNRLVRLSGHGRVTLATKAIDEATQGIIRYLQMQSLVNACFGVAVAGGLFLIGVPYPLLWGALAGLLRFIPYVGAWMAALLPITMSLAVFPGWSKPLLVIALFAVLEPFIYAVVEPLLYGHSIGVSQTALLVAVAFWTWVWGPIGLLLATPLTVCLVVVGKYVPDLEFILTLVSDRPVLTPEVAYYQRLIAMDQDEAAAIAETQLEALGAPRIYDEVMLPALTYARRDRARGRLTDGEVGFVARASREILEGTFTPPAAVPTRARVLGVTGRDEIDEVALRMLSDVLAPSGVVVGAMSSETLTSEVVSRVEEMRPAGICVVALPPGGLAHTRYLLKRLRARFPEVGIVVGRWGSMDIQEEARPLLAAGADRVGTTLATTREHVLELLPVAESSPMARTA